jgi:ABC-type Zn uptake system ZnuABC Zn-binding protein ZnuA
VNARSPKSLTWLTVFMVIGALLTSCGNGNKGATNDRLTIVASTSVIAAIAEQVGGDTLVHVEALIGPGVDPHTFEMTPGDIRTLADADIILLNGLGLDDYLRDDVKGANDSAMLVVVSDGVQLLRADKQGSENSHDKGEFDPHIWQDPLRVKVMAENIAEALVGADPEHATEYRDNAAAYQETLDGTDNAIRVLIEEIPSENRKLVTNHDAFAYFADRYGLEIVGTVIPGSTSEADPSASDIAKLTQLIKNEGVKAIFAEALINPKVAESLASDTGVQIIYGLYSDQVGEPGSGAETVDGMLLANAKKISEALR